jgi:hypothetical protein
MGKYLNTYNDAYQCRYHIKSRRFTKTINDVEDVLHNINNALSKEYVFSLELSVVAEVLERL